MRYTCGCGYSEEREESGAQYTTRRNKDSCGAEAETALIDKACSVGLSLVCETRSVG
jgi:hypothetical protein